MCQDRDVKPVPVELQARILARNDDVALHTRLDCAFGSVT